MSDEIQLPTGESRMDLATVMLPPAPKSGDVETLMDFARYAYSREGQRVALPPSIRRQVAKNLQLDEDDWAELRLRASQDHLFRVPWQMLAAVVRSEAEALLVVRIIELVRMAFDEHPVSTPVHGDGVSSEVSSKLAAIGNHFDEGRGRSDRGDDGDGFLELSRLLSSTEQHPKGDVELIQTIGERATDRADAFDPEGVTLAPRDRAALVENLVNTAVLALATAQRWPASLVAGVLHDGYWQSARSEQPDVDVVLLTDSPKADLMTLVVEIWSERIDLARERVEEAHRDRDAHVRQAWHLQQQMDGVAEERLRARTEVDRLQRLAGDLQDEVSGYRQRLADSRAHASDDYETLRSRALRRAKQNVELLQEGLHALRRSQPLVQVTEERLERVIEVLEKELRLLREDGTT